MPLPRIAKYPPGYDPEKVGETGLKDYVLPELDSDKAYAVSASLNTLFTALNSVSLLNKHGHRLMSIYLMTRLGLNGFSFSVDIEGSLLDTQKRSEEHTSELQSLAYLLCLLLL